MRPSSTNTPYWRAISFLVALAIVIFVTAISVEPAQRDWLMKEGGPVEVLSALGYMLCVGVMWLQGGKSYVQKYWYFAVVLLAFASRELDFDKRFTNFGVLKSKFFIHPDVSWWGKLIAAAILGVILYALINIIRRHGKAFLRDTFTFNWTVPVFSVGLAGAFLVVSKSLDGLRRKLMGWDIMVISKESDKIASMAEEAMEIAVPYLFMIAIVYVWRHQQRNVNPIR